MIGFLIERHFNSELRYWNGRSTEAIGFTPKHDEACRFARHEDAAIVLSWLLDGNGKVAEHSWGVPDVALSNPQEHNKKEEQG